MHIGLESIGRNTTSHTGRCLARRGGCPHKHWERNAHGREMQTSRLAGQKESTLAEGFARSSFTFYLPDVFLIRLLYLVLSFFVFSYSVYSLTSLFLLCSFLFDCVSLPVLLPILFTLLLNIFLVIFCADLDLISFLLSLSISVRVCVLCFVLLSVSQFICSSFMMSGFWTR
mgnify:CR=1 FL=1